MASLRWRFLLVAVLSEPALAYHSGASAFARGVSHRQPLLSRTSLPACAERERLPAAVLPITLTVFAQMIGEGLALTSLPLHMKNLGASTVLSGVAVSGFSLSSLLFTPVVVRLSSRTGRYQMLRVCLLGCSLAQLLIVRASTPGGIVVGRLVSGVFAASVPVAQAAVTDLVHPAQSALALSRVSAVSQLGVVVGPAFGALAIAALNRLGVADVAGMHMRCVFAVSSAFAMSVLLLQLAFRDAAKAAKPAEPPTEPRAGVEGAAGSEAVSPSGRRRTDALPLSSKATEAAEALPLVPLVRKVPYDQWALRLVAISIGWGLTLCMATYCLFGSAIVGYSQQQLSINFSAAAVISVVAQLALFPRLVGRLGEHLVCALGLTVSSIGLIGVSPCKRNPDPNLTLTLTLTLARTLTLTLTLTLTR